MSIGNATSPSLIPSDIERRSALISGAAAILAMGIALFAFRGSAATLGDAWLTSEEYNFGPIVPPLVAFILWREYRRSSEPVRGGWLGFLIVLVGMALGVLEFLSHTRLPGQLGLMVTLIGIVVAWQGEARARRFWPGFVLLLFSVPAPAAIQVPVTEALQLVSSRGAVDLLRAVGVTVFREGNVIDLGSMRLAVAEACSGLRYLLPLSTFAFLCAYLFNGTWWQRGIIFLSSIPITIVMNVFRIALTGVLVEWWGQAAAEGFFHDFEGWAVYTACVAILALEMKVICMLGRRSLLASLDLDFSPPSVAKPEGPRRKVNPTLVAVSAAIVLVVLEVAIGSRASMVPNRLPFAQFPREINGWFGMEAPVDEASLKVLNATDYLSVSYLNGDVRVETWVAYYDAQYVGNAVHSPEVCIPGGGWEIQSNERRSLVINDAATGGGVSWPLPVNRLIIARGGLRAMVYYWFVEGGVPFADATEAKINLVSNAIIHNRRDGALVRFITEISGNDVAGADGRLSDFIRATAPRLQSFLN